jgi:hypothetical protein
LLADRLHHELLKVAAEQEQPVLVRQDDHVLAALAAGGVVPHQGHQGGRIGFQIPGPGRLVAGRRAGEQAVDVQPLEGRRK